MDAVEVTARRTDGSGRWLRLLLSLRPNRTGPLVTYRTGFTFNIRPVDDLSASYQIVNWESGIRSGLGFALRRTADRDWGVQVDILEGDLGSADMTGLARAATIAAFQLHGQEPPAQVDNEWNFESQTVATIARPEITPEGIRPAPPPASVS